MFPYRMSINFGQLWEKNFHTDRDFEIWDQKRTVWWSLMEFGGVRWSLTLVVWCRVLTVGLLVHQNVRKIILAIIGMTVLKGPSNLQPTSVFGY